MGLGPRDEKAAITGAGFVPCTVLTRVMRAKGVLMYTNHISRKLYKFESKMEGLQIYLVEFKYSKTRFPSV